MGIDPGKSGAICAINRGKEVVPMFDMPLKANPNKKENGRKKIDTAMVLTLLFQLAKDYGGIRYAALERPHAIFGKATKSAMFTRIEHRIKPCIETPVLATCIGEFLSKIL